MMGRGLGMKLWTWVLMAGFSVGATAEQVGRFEFGLAPGVGVGDVDYQIGKTVQYDGVVEPLPYPISRLKFPIRAIWAEGWLRWYVSPSWEAWFRGGHTLTDVGGNVQDSDWEYPWGQAVLAVYSESEARYTAWNMETGLQWWFWRHPRPGEQEWAAALGVGWLREFHAWEAGGGRQTYPATPWVPPDTWEGVAITYDVATDFPFAALALRVQQPEMWMEARGFLSPIARIRDRDDHVLRGILAELKTHGIGGGAEVALRYRITPRWHVLASLRWWAFAADGNSKNRVYAELDENVQAGDTWTIYEEIRGETVRLIVGVGARW